MVRTALALATACTITATGAFAQSPGDGLSFGLFGSAGTSPYIGESTQLGLLPFVSYQSGPFSIGLDGVRYRFLEQGGHSLSVQLTPRFSGIDDDNAALAALDRDITADFGLGYTFNTQTGLRFSASAVQEVTGEHEGQEVDVRVGQSFRGSPVSVYAGVTWQSSDLAEYLYGVRPGETGGGLTVYEPGSVVTPYIGVNTVFPVGERAAIIGSVEARQFGDAISDSPIIDESGTVTARVGVSFRF